MYSLRRRNFILKLKAFFIATGNITENSDFVVPNNNDDAQCDTNRIYKISNF